MIKFRSYSKIRRCCMSSEKHEVPPSIIDNTINIGGPGNDVKPSELKAVPIPNIPNPSISISSKSPLIKKRQQSALKTKTQLVSHLEKEEENLPKKMRIRIAAVFITPLLAVVFTVLSALLIFSSTLSGALLLSCAVLCFFTFVIIILTWNRDKIALDLKTRIDQDKKYLYIQDKDFEKLLDDVLTLKELTQRLNHPSFQTLQFIILNNKLSPLQRAYLQERINLALREAQDYLTSWVIERNETKDNRLRQFQKNLNQLTYLLSLSTPVQHTPPPRPLPPPRDFGAQANAIAGTDPLVLTPDVQEKDKPFILAWLYYKEGQALHKNPNPSANPAPIPPKGAQPQQLSPQIARTEAECYKLALDEINKIERTLTLEEQYLQAKIIENYTKDPSTLLTFDPAQEKEKSALWLLRRAKQLLRNIRNFQDSSNQKQKIKLAAEYARLALQALNTSYDFNIPTYELPNKREKINQLFESLLALNLDEKTKKYIRYQKAIASLSIYTLMVNETELLDNFRLVLQDRYLNSNLKTFIVAKFREKLTDRGNPVKTFQSAVLFIEEANDFLKINLNNLDIFSEMYEGVGENRTLSNKDYVTKRFSKSKENAGQYNPTSFYEESIKFLEEAIDLLENISDEQPTLPTENPPAENNEASEEKKFTGVEEFEAQYYVLRFQENIINFAAAHSAAIHNPNHEYNVALAELLTSYYEAFEALNKETVSPETKANFKALSASLAAYIYTINPSDFKVLTLFKNRKDFCIAVLHILIQTRNTMYDQEQTQQLFKTVISTLQYSDDTTMTIGTLDTFASLVNNYAKFFNHHILLNSDSTEEKNSLEENYFVRKTPKDGTLSYPITFISLEELHEYLWVVKGDLEKEIEKYKESLSSSLEDYLRNHHDLYNQLLNSGITKDDYLTKGYSFVEKSLTTFNPIEAEKIKADVLLYHLNILLNEINPYNREAIQDHDAFFMIYHSEDLRTRLEQKIGQPFMIIETAVKAQLKSDSTFKFENFPKWGEGFVDHCRTIAAPKESVVSASVPASNPAPAPVAAETSVEKNNKKEQEILDDTYPKIDEETPLLNKTTVKSQEEENDDNTQNSENSKSNISEEKMATIKSEVQGVFSGFQKEPCYKDPWYKNKDKTAQHFFKTALEPSSQKPFFDWLVEVLENPILALEHKIELFTLVNNQFKLSNFIYSEEDNFKENIACIKALATPPASV